LFLPAIAEEPASPINLEGKSFVFAQSLTILLVEDNPLTRQSTEEMLKIMGFQVLTAGNGREALAIFQKQEVTVDLVISDIIMPEIGGVELYQMLQEISPNPRMLMMTAYPFEEQARRLLEKGRVAWVQKPYKIEEMAEKIEAVLAT
jgi:CheY-like chemotaxis protein